MAHHFPWGVLPEPLYATTTSPWNDSVRFIDGVGAPLNIVAPFQLALRRAVAVVGHDLVVADSELTIVDNLASWHVPADRMATLTAGVFDMEITTHTGIDRRVEIRGQVFVLAGIVP